MRLRTCPARGWSSCLPPAAVRPPDGATYSTWPRGAEGDRGYAERSDRRSRCDSARQRGPLARRTRSRTTTRAPAGANPGPSVGEPVPAGGAAPGDTRRQGRLPASTRSSRWGGRGVQRTGDAVRLRPFAAMDGGGRGPNRRPPPIRSGFLTAIQPATVERREPRPAGSRRRRPARRRARRWWPGCRVWADARIARTGSSPENSGNRARAHSWPPQRSRCAAFDPGLLSSAGRPELPR